MLMITLAAFTFLGASFLSLWIKRDPKIWGSLLFLTLLTGLIAGYITWIGLIFILCLFSLWTLNKFPPNPYLFIAIICLSTCFKLKLLPGYIPVSITPKFAVGLENPLVGLFPLALIVPLAKSSRDWKLVMKGFAVGCAGIALLACLAILSGVIKWDIKLPSHMILRILSNLILTSIPEEGFYRGFVQNTLCYYFKNMKLGKIAALLLTSLLFAMTHIFWSPNLGILAFTFLASLLYGGVYLFSGKIESAILSHFLLNFIHITFFSYHAL